jgi:hypothetical protein
MFMLVCGTVRPWLLNLQKWLLRYVCSKHLRQQMHPSFKKVFAQFILHTYLLTASSEALYSDLVALQHGKGSQKQKLHNYPLFF